MGEILREELVDVREIKIDGTDDIDKRMRSYKNQIKNPYRFKYKDIIVTLLFSGKESLEDKLTAFLKSKIK